MMLRVKICGMQELAAAKAAEECGADFIGFVFADSKRRIEVVQAAGIRRALRRTQCVGVFVNESLQRVNEIAEEAGLDYVQLHGQESAAYARGVRRPVIKAFRWGDDFDLAQVQAYPAEYILVDSFRAGQAGGTGQTFSWQEAAPALRHLRKPWFLAGGLNAQNVLAAAAALSPFAVDVSGGVEMAGRKSIEKIRQFMNVIRERS